MINIQQYKPHYKLTKEQLFDNNFKYIDGCYSYRFPVYKYKKETLLWALFIINLETKTCEVTVVNKTYNTYAAFHNRKYGSNDSVVESIDNKINAQIDLFIKNKIITKKRGKNNGISN